MAVKPIIFNGEMVRAILDGRKTQTRRVLKKQDWPAEIVRRFPRQEACVPYAPGDLLWVRETWAVACEVDSAGCMESAEQVYYRASGEPFDDYHMPDGSIREGIPWKPSLHMPRWASRLTLRVTDVRVQRVQEISEDDAEAEGVGRCQICNGVGWLNAGPDGGEECGNCGSQSYAEESRDLWDSINAKRGYGWDANPWVVALTFEAIRKNVDDVEAP